MSRSYRGIIIAAVGFLILANAAQGKDSDRQQGNSASAAQQNVAAPAIVEPAPNPDQGNAAQPQCIDEYGAKRDCTSASAQATVDQASYAYWQAMAGGFGVALGIGTLIAAGAAAYFAERAAHFTMLGSKAASETLEHARETTAVQLRPYLAFAPLNDELEPRPGNFSFEPFKLKNFGQLPAKNVRITRATEMVSRPIGDRIVDHDQRVTEIIPWLAPGASIPIIVHLMDLTAHHAEMIKSGERVLLSRWRVDYDLPDGSRDFDDVTLFLCREHIEGTFMGNIMTSAERERTE